MIVRGRGSMKVSDEVSAEFSAEVSVEVLVKVLGDLMMEVLRGIKAVDPSALVGLFSINPWWLIGRSGQQGGVGPPAGQIMGPSRPACWKIAGRPAVQQASLAACYQK